MDRKRTVLVVSLWGVADVASAYAASIPAVVEFSSLLGLFFTAFVFFTINLLFKFKNKSIFLCVWAIWGLFSLFGLLGMVGCFNSEVGYRQEVIVVHILFIVLVAAVNFYAYKKVKMLNK